MSSDYGSDILSDDINIVESLHFSSAQPLRELDVSSTPPPSSQLKRKACDTPSESQRKMRNISTVAHRIPLTPVNQSPAFPSSHPLPSNMTRQTPLPYTPPPSSQRMQVQRSIDAYPSQTPQSVRPSVPAKTTSISPKQLAEAPLYRFPFGTHRGKTLLEVPDNYLAYFRMDEGMKDRMPGLSNALSLFDAGQPPIAPLPPPLTTAVIGASRRASLVVRASQNPIISICQYTRRSALAVVELNLLGISL